MIRGFRSHRDDQHRREQHRPASGRPARWPPTAGSTTSPGRARAWQNLVAVARGVIQDDGSDVEGSPGYAMYIEKLLQRRRGGGGHLRHPRGSHPGAARARCTSSWRRPCVPTSSSSRSATRINQSLRGTFGIGDWRADWIRSAGAAGAPADPGLRGVRRRLRLRPRRLAPAARRPRHLLLAALLVGAPEHRRMRTTTAPRMTLYSRGVEWVGDPGPYRYENGSSLRVVHEVAHGALVGHRQQRRSQPVVRRPQARRRRPTGRSAATTPPAWPTAPGAASASRAAPSTCARSTPSSSSTT